MEILKARFKRWRHQLRCLFTGDWEETHQSVNGVGLDGRIAFISCSCGETFWTEVKLNKNPEA